MMGNNYNKVLTTISRPFEFMSVDVNQKIYRRVVELIGDNFPNQIYRKLNPLPSSFKGENLPVESIPYDNVDLWIKGLNELSKRDNLPTQEALGKLFPGHRRGQVYSLPTDAQWEFVSRLGGVAEGNYCP